MVKVFLFFAGLAILLASFHQMILMFRDGTFRARGNRLIARNAHPIIFWLNFAGLVLFGLVGVAVICWQLLT
jgi:ABC-type nickel/cobalt efflux system permease component RcnA